MKGTGRIVINLILSIIMLVLYVFYLLTSWAYIKSYFWGGAPLDLEALRLSEGHVTVQKFDAFASTDRARAHSTTIGSLYLQRFDYRFSIVIDGYRETGFGYAFDDEGRAVPAASGSYSNKLAIITMGGVDYLAILPSFFSFKAGDTCEDVLLMQISDSELQNLGAAGFEGTLLSDYMLDLTGTAVDSEAQDSLVAVAAAIVFPLYFGYSLICLFFPKLRMK